MQHSGSSHLCHVEHVNVSNSLTYHRVHVGQVKVDVELTEASRCMGADRGMFVAQTTQLRDVNLVLAVIVMHQKPGAA